METRSIPVNLLAIAFPNPIDWGKLDQMKQDIENGNDNFPPIAVYTSSLDGFDLGSDEILLSGEPVQEWHLEETIYYIEDGYHRATAHLESGLEHIQAIILY